MTQYLFVGEKPSQTAFDNGYTWESGKLAAKTLFDALDLLGIDNGRRDFINLFGNDPTAVEKDNTRFARTVLAVIRNRVATTIIVAMGQKVSKILTAHHIPHRKLVHPAARGKIRKKDVYQQHVADVINGVI